MKQMQLDAISKLDSKPNLNNKKSVSGVEEYQKSFGKEYLVFRYWQNDEGGEDRIEEDRVEDLEVITENDQLDKYLGHSKKI
jgi:hypothetical protein